MSARLIKQSTQAGISLLEVLLSVSITALIIMGAVQMVEDWSKRARLRDEAGYLFTVSNAAKSYVSSHFTDIMVRGFAETLGDNNGDSAIDNADLDNIGRALTIPMDDTAGSLFHLKDGVAGLPVSFPSTTPLGRNVQIYVRNMGFIGTERVLEVITVTTLDSLDNRLPLSALDARDIAQAIGPEAGLYEHANSCQGSALQSAYGSWRLNNSFLATGANLMAAPAATPYCPPIDADRGITAYVVLQSRVALDGGRTDDYLFRISILGAPELNQMKTNIDMNGNPIVNVAALSVDSLQVDGNAVINASESGTALYVDKKFQVAGNGSYISGKRETSPTGTPRIGGGGNLQVKGSGASLSASSFNGEGSALNANKLTVNNGLTIGKNLNVAGELTASQSVTTGQMATTSTVLSGGGSTKMTQLLVASPSEIKTLSSDQMSAAVLQASDSMTVTDLQVIGDVSFGSATLNEGLTATQLQTYRLTRCEATVVYDHKKKAYVRSAKYDCKEGPK